MDELFTPLLGFLNSSQKCEMMIKVFYFHILFVAKSG
jgi:hypothetical protein